jgi:hypothetical protein
MQEYNNIDKKIHQLTQIIAKVNRTFVPKKADDSHTNLFFDQLSHRMYGRWIKTINQNIILTLNLQTNKFEWLDDSLATLHSIDIAGSKYEQLEEYVEESLEGFGLDKKGFRNEMHYKIPIYSFLNKPFEKFDQKAIEIWEVYRGLANVACGAMLGFLQNYGEIRIWPDHFDTGIYVTPSEDIGLGFGLAMKDSMVGNPYFYFSGYSLNGKEINYTNVPNLDLGKWIINDQWKGAVLSLNEIKSSDITKINSFILNVCQWFLKNNNN